MKRIEQPNMIYDYGFSLNKTAVIKDNYGIPEIFEDEAAGFLRLIYCDIQHVLKVPIVNFIFRTMALYEKFLALAWQQVRPSMLTVDMEKASADLRQPDILFDIPKVNWNKYYDQYAIDRIRKIVFTFSYVNTKLLIIASAWSESLGNRPVSGRQSAEGFIVPGIIPGLPRIKLLQVEDAPGDIRNLLIDIQNKHNAMDVASDFRALAYFPEFLKTGWEHLKPYVGTREYNTISSDLKSRAIEYAHTMPFPVTVNRQALQNMYPLPKAAGIMGLVKMFQDFLPGLIIDCEFFWRIIS